MYALASKLREEARNGFPLASLETIEIGRQGDDPSQMTKRLQHRAGDNQLARPGHGGKQYRTRELRRDRTGDPRRVGTSSLSPVHSATLSQLDESTRPSGQRARQI